MMKAILFEVQKSSIEESACFKHAYLKMFLEIGNVRIPKKPH